MYALVGRLRFSSRRRITINCYVRWDYGLEVSGAEGWLTEVSVAPLGDDKKIVLHRIVLKLSGPCNIAQTYILYQWGYVTRLL